MWDDMFSFGWGYKASDPFPPTFARSAEVKVSARRTAFIFSAFGLGLGAGTSGAASSDASGSEGRGDSGGAETARGTSTRPRRGYEFGIKIA